MIWDDNVVKLFVINGYIICIVIFFYLFISIYVMWMDIWCESIFVIKLCILKFMEIIFSGGFYMKRLGVIIECSFYKF